MNKRHRNTFIVIATVVGCLFLSIVAFAADFVPFETLTKFQLTIKTTKLTTKTFITNHLFDLKSKILEPNPELDSNLNPDIPQVPIDSLVDQGTTFPDPFLDSDLSLIEDTTVPEQILEIPQDFVNSQPEILIGELVLKNLSCNNPNHNNPIIPKKVTFVCN